MVRSGWSCATCALVLATLVACGGSAKKTETEKRLETIQMERKSDRLLEQGKGYLALGDFNRAEQYLAVALENGAPVKTTMPLLLKACVLGERYRIAIDYAESYLRSHPDDADLRYVLGTIYSAVGDNPRAAENLLMVVKVRPDYADARFALGVAYRDARQLGDADLQFREYLRLQPRGPHAAEAHSSVFEEVPQPTNTFTGDGPREIRDGGSSIPTPLFSAPSSGPIDAGAAPIPKGKR